MSQSQWMSVYRAVLKETNDESAAQEAADTAVADQEGRHNAKAKRFRRDADV